MKMRLISYRKNEKFKWKYCLKWKKVHLFRSNKIFDWITITTQEKTMEIREYMKWSNGNMKFDYFSCFFFFVFAEVLFGNFVFLSIFDLYFRLYFSFTLLLFFRVQEIAWLCFLGMLKIMMMMMGLFFVHICLRCKNSTPNIHASNGAHMYKILIFPPPSPAMARIWFFFPLQWQ